MNAWTYVKGWSRDAWLDQRAALILVGYGLAIGALIGLILLLVGVR